jgi:hypothetical protein
MPTFVFFAFRPYLSNRGADPFDFGRVGKPLTRAFGRTPGSYLSDDPSPRYPRFRAETGFSPYLANRGAVPFGFGRVL